MSMLHKAIQNRWCRLALAVAATLLYAIGVNWFIVPMGLYTGGLLGFCQVARTLIVEALGLSPNVDFSGILYLAANVPILLLAWQALGRGFLVRTAVCTVTSSLFLSLVPPPAAPLVEETLTNCVLGGILVGFSLGIVLTCGCSTGGLDILGLWLAKKGKGFSVGRFSLSFNALLYTLCAVLFGLRAAIYSIIYTVFCALFIDRGHQQNITEQVLIFTKDEDPELPRNIMARLGRGVTYWEGKGAYTGAPLHFIGHLQTNKVRQVVGKVDLIQSVDSPELLAMIEKRAAMQDTVQDILLEVNIGGESAKSGVDPDALPQLLETAAACAHIRVRGLMAIPPVAETSDGNHAYFTKMHELFVDIGRKKYDNASMDFLSMGMSGDFEDAIAAGANMVRVGSSIFGARDYSRH